MMFARLWQAFRSRGPVAAHTSSGTTVVPEKEFEFPLPGPARIALLEGGFRTGRNMREFTHDDLAWLRSYAPEALVAPLQIALSLADQKLRGLFELPSLETAIVVLTSIQDSPLADHHRDLLWKAFGVPIFEQLRGSDGAILARECEVHDGLHIDAQPELHGHELFVAGTRTGLTGEIVASHCDCGSETPRLRKLAPLHNRAAIAAA